MDIFKLYLSSHNDGCSCGDSHDDLDFDEAFEDAEIILIDPDTNEEFSFIFYDNFVFEDEEYCVLVTKDDEDEDDEEAFSWLIMKYSCDEDGEESLISLETEDEDRIYAVYEAILDEMDEDEENEEE